MTRLSIDCRLGFAVVGQMGFKVFLCGLWVVGLISPLCNRSLNQQTNAGL